MTGLQMGSAASAHPGRDTSSRVQVMICDDSPVIRSALATILQACEAIEIVARVAHGGAALETLRLCHVDVVILDIDMPIMDGLTALPLLLAHSPGLPVIMSSTLTTRGAEMSMRALRLGAADTIAKPSAAGLFDGQGFGPELIAKILCLGRQRRRNSASPSSIRATSPVWALRPPPDTRPVLLAIGSSTGGPNALFDLVRQLGPNLPVPIVLTQHLPALFTPILAHQLERLGTPCAEAVHGRTLRPGTITLAPGNRHLHIQRCGAVLAVALDDGPPENFCRPAVDPMLRSASDATGGRLLITILTGMGQDGLDGSRHAVRAGGTVIAQDEATSVVWGMPGAVARAGLAHAILPLCDIGAKLTALTLGVASR